MMRGRRAEDCALAYILRAARFEPAWERLLLEICVQLTALPQAALEWFLYRVTQLVDPLFPEVCAMRHRCHRSLLLLLAVLAFAAVPGLAAPYPEKPIRLIVPSAPGGAPDVLMRTLAQQLSQQMGVPFVIDNKPGGSYLIGTMELVRAPADGYTLAYGNIVSLATNRSLIASMPYDIDRDLTLISNSLRLANLMIVNNSLPVKNVAELIAYAKKNPGKISFASDGNGTTAHLGVELFKSVAGIDMLHVPYKAATAAVTDLISGNIQLMMINTPVSGPQAQAGRVRALGISSIRRSPTYPDVPTIAESGVSGFEVEAWGGIIGPANMPKDIVARLNEEIRTALANPVLRERFRSLGAETSPSTPEEFRELSRRETAKWAAVVKSSGAKVD
jgi:tripartite-type tricarboxylate transporter receptor subunit TctC